MLQVLIVFPDGRLIQGYCRCLLYQVLPGSIPDSALGFFPQFNPVSLTLFEEHREFTKCFHRKHTNLDNRNFKSNY